MLKGQCSRGKAGGKESHFTLEACSWREGGLLLKGQLPLTGKSFKGDFGVRRPREGPHAEQPTRPWQVPSRGWSSVV